jgi:hypothetical protein
MEVNKEELSIIYSEKSNDELLGLHSAGTLTDLAYDIIENELHSRNISVPSRRTYKQTPKKPMNKILYFALVIIAWFAVSIYHNSGKEQRLEKALNEEMSEIDYKQNNNETIESLLLETAYKLNEQTPMMVDAETRLDLITSIGKLMQYKYTMINSDKNNINSNQFQNEMRAMLTNNQCANKDILLFLNNGVSYQYTHFDKNGLLISVIKISIDNCK